MVLKRLLNANVTRNLTVLSVALEAKRSFDRGNRLRAGALLIVTVLAWKWAMIGMIAQGIVKGVRRGRPTA